MRQSFNIILLLGALQAGMHPVKNLDKDLGPIWTKTGHVFISRSERSLKIRLYSSKRKGSSVPVPFPPGPANPG